MLCPLTMDFDKRRLWRLKNGSISNKDLELLQKSGISVLHPAEGWPAEGAVRLLAEWNSLIAQYDSLLVRVDTPADIDRAKASGRIGAILGVHNSEHFQSVDDVTRFYELGQ
jgi:microsomal dipeptidase-like Zn-dependent dipeptidase